MRDGLLVLTVVVVCAPALPAQVLDALPTDFSGLTTVETFEGIASAMSPTVLLPVGFVLPTGVVVDQIVNFAEVIDFTVCGCGFFLGEAGSIDAGSTLPSAPSSLAVCGAVIPGSIGFTFAEPVSRVGVYFEDTICSVPACPVEQTGEVTLEAFSTGGSLGSVSAFADGGLDDALDSWIGLATADGSASITSIVVSGSCFILDDLNLDLESLVPTFIRGDANDDGVFDISDAVYSLSALFIPGAPAPACADSGDSNDDGAFDISDAIATLSALFSMGPPPSAPHPGCGGDPTADGLDCDSYGSCP